MVTVRRHAEIAEGSSRILDRMERLRVDAADFVRRLARAEDATRVAAAVTAAHHGEPVVSLGLGALETIRRDPAVDVVRHALGLAACIEVRSLRRPVRRMLLDWLEASDDALLETAASRKLVLARGPRGGRDAVVESLSPTRRKMLRLTERDGAHCVWCSTPLTHLSLHATIDHVRCRSAGGVDGLDNLVLACAPCNFQRADSPAALWLATLLSQGIAVDRVAVRAAITRSHRRHRALPSAA